MPERRFRVKINTANTWTEYYETLPYTIVGVANTDQIEVQPIGESSFDYGIPQRIYSLQDVVYTRNTGTYTIATSQVFTGGNLSYSLQSSPLGSSINPSTGVVSINTAIASEYALQQIIIRASNTKGFAEAQFLVSILNIYQAPFVTVNPNGWSASYANTPPTFDPFNSPAYFTVNRQGFDVLGQPTVYQDNLVLTKRIRQPYPNEAFLTANQAAISDYVYAGDTVVNANNASIEISPKPIANWVQPDRKVVGNILTTEMLAFHRNARGREQIACVLFTATDSSNNVATQIVSTSSVSTNPTDQNKIIVYRCDVDITNLTNNSLVTLNAKVFPWFGNANSVLDSSTANTAREFSPRYFYKNVLGSTAPVVTYVSNTGGSDANGVVSSDPVLARATPCATIGGAINRLVAVNSTVDGCEIRLMSGTHAINTAAYSTTRPQNFAALTITRDPLVAKSNVLMTYGVATVRPRLGAAGGWLTLKDIRVSRTGTFSPQGEAASSLRYNLEDVDFDNGSINASLYGATCDGGCYGTTFSNLGSSVLNAGARELRIVRGCRANTAVEGWLVVGSYLENMGGALIYGSRTASGSIVSYNTFSGTSSSGTGFINLGGAADVSGAALCQNVFEYKAPISQSSMRFSADGATGSTYHIIYHHNTMSGTFIHGRTNAFYNDGVVPRSNKLMSMKGNIHVQLNTKHDVFQSDGTRIEGWGYLYGVGCEGEFSQFIDASETGLGGNFAQEFFGFNGSVGTSRTVRQNPMFILDGSTDGANTGPGNGDYRISTMSPAKQRVVNSVLRFDMQGLPRPATYSSAGVHE